MLKVVFNNEPESSYTAEFDKQGENLVVLTGVPAIAGGFVLSRPDKVDNWDYSAYNTIYRVTEDSVIFSNDESVYIEPTEEIKGTIFWNDGEDADGMRPESVTLAVSDGTSKVITAEDDWFFNFGEFYVKDNVVLTVEDEIEDYYYNVRKTGITMNHTTIAELQEQKVEEMNKVQQQIIAAGTDVEFADGHTEHFTLSAQDQASIEGLALLVAGGAEQLPWHTSDETAPCKFYNAEDMTAIIEAATSYVTYHVTYFRDLRIYIRSIDNKADLYTVHYGMMIPEEYQSDVMKAIGIIPEVIPEEEEIEIPEEPTEGEEATEEPVEEESVEFEEPETEEEA